MRIRPDVLPRPAVSLGDGSASPFPPPGNDETRGGPIDTFEVMPSRDGMTFVPPRLTERGPRPLTDDPQSPGPTGAPAPTLPPRERFFLRGVEMRSYGALPAALAEARRILETMVTRPDIEERFRKAGVTMVIVPANTRMTDLPEFAHLRGRRTFDGRPFEEVRGVATYGRDGRYYVAVPEENLASLPEDGYLGAEGYSVGIHELGHAILERGVSGAERFFERVHFGSGKDRKGFVTPYAKANYHEYMAESTGAYFRRNLFAGERNSPKWLQQNDPVMYFLLFRIYGPPPSPPAPTPKKG